jgi:MFS family permease
MFFGNYFSTFFSYVYKVYGENKGLSDSLLTAAGAVSSIANGGSRLLFGQMVDKINFKIVITILLTMQLVVACICVDVVNYPAIYFLCVFFNFAGLGSLFAVFPPAVMQIFGMKVGPVTYTLILQACAATSVANIFNAKYLMKAISVRGVCYVGAGGLAVGIFLLWLIDEHPVWEQAKDKDEEGKMSFRSVKSSMKNP